ncbi:hypothetical protein TrLO_g12824 [Triparma laevis f. longispina]|uniref:Uncharacterized protein n=1 Tax=Triparma laevis f. longispina TaxID=1714387 RepID=A0A9W7AWD0_9STRA|nr:hypothetical protein TrLO_g12824 [Triparma laevis f. longispina]
MSKYVASESNEGYDSHKTGGKRGAGDEGIIQLPPAESLSTLTTVPTVPTTTDQFIFTPAFRRHFFKYVPGDTLMRLRLATKGWKAAADVFIDEGMRRGPIIVHGGNDISIYATNDRKESLELVTRVLFLLNVTKVGEYACYAFNLVVVDIPEGIESIVIAYLRSQQSTP